MNVAELVGATLDDRYEVVRLLGEGGMGSVFEARQTTTGRRVAVKVIQSLDLAKNPQLLARFEREARAAGGIESKHIAQVLDIGADPKSGFPFLVMELLDGEDCSQLLRRVGPVAPELALRIVAQACLGLTKAHEAGVLHRDIKPANLFLARRDDDLVVKLLDFGVAKIREEQSAGQWGEGLTRTGSMIGSPLFMAPEQARGLRSIDHRADLWSLGVVLYQLLSGRTPHQDLQALGELILAICTDPAAPVQHFAPWVPPEVAAITRDALRIDPSDRYPTAQAMLDAITKLLPDGWAIEDGQLVAMAAADRAVVAPRLEVSPAAPSPIARASVPPIATPITVRPSGPLESTDALAATAVVADLGPPSTPPSASQSVPPTAPSEPAPPPARASVTPIAPAASTPASAAVASVRAPAPADTDAGAARSTAPQARRPGATWVVVGAALAGVAIGGALKLLGGAPARAPDPAPALTTTAGRTVRLAVTPAEASVEIDGARATTRAGLVEISGSLGSVHKVRLTSGATSRVIDVVISEAGAVPSKLDLAPPPGR